METFYDSVGNELKPGDLIRMYHFTGAQNRKHYMYKRFLKYVKGKKDTFGVFEHLDNEGTFRAKQDHVKDNIVVVQRSKFEHKNLKRNRSLRD